MRRRHSRAAAAGQTHCAPCAEVGPVLLTHTRVRGLQRGQGLQWAGRGVVKGKARQESVVAVTGSRRLAPCGGHSGAGTSEDGGKQAAGQRGE